MGRSTSLALLDAIGKGLAFAAAIVVARVCGPGALGDLSVAQAFAAYALIAGNCGLEMYAVRTAVADTKPLGKLISTVVLVRLATSSVSFLLLLVIAALVPGVRSSLLVVLLYGLSVFSTALSLNWVSQAVRKTRIMGLALVGSQAVYLAVVFAVVNPTNALWLVPTALVTGEFLMAAVVFGWVRRAVCAPEAPLSVGEAFGILRGAFPIGATQVLRAVALGSDLVIVGMLTAAADAGHYSAAYRFYQAGISAIGFYAVANFPRIAQVAHTDASRLSRELHASIALILAIGVPAAIAVSWPAADILTSFFGAGFDDASGAFRLLIATLLVYGTGAHFRSALIGLNRQKLDTLAGAVAAATHVAGKVVLGMSYGITGVALGALAGELTYLVLGAALYSGAVARARR